MPEATIIMRWEGGAASWGEPGAKGTQCSTIVHVERRYSDPDRALRCRH
jgi:hypothetical protein